MVVKLVALVLLTLQEADSIMWTLHNTAEKVGG